MNKFRAICLAMLVNAFLLSGCSSPSANLSTSNTERFLIHKNGETVLDSTTKLVWQRCSIGQKWNGQTCTGNPTKFNHDQAMQAAEAFNKSSDSNGQRWEVPTIRQLISLKFCSNGYRVPTNYVTAPRIDVQDGGPPRIGECSATSALPTIDSLAMPGTPLGYYKSSSSKNYVDVNGRRYSLAGHRWEISFKDGGIYSSSPSGNDSGYVRLVRVGERANDPASEGFTREKLAPMDQLVRTAKNNWTSSRLTQETQSFINFAAANALAYTVYKGGPGTSFAIQKACSLDTQNVRKFLLSGASEIWYRHGRSDVDEMHSISEENMFWVGDCLNGKASGEGIIVYFYRGKINSSDKIGAVRTVVTVNNGNPTGTIFAYSNARTCFNTCQDNSYAKEIGKLSEGSAGVDLAQQDVVKVSNQNNQAMGALLGSVMVKAAEVLKEGADASSSVGTVSGSQGESSSGGWKVVNQYEGGVADFGFDLRSTVFVVRCGRGSEYKMYRDKRGLWGSTGLGGNNDSSTLEEAAGKKCK